MTSSTPIPFNLSDVRANFPILSRRVQKHPLAYLDNAATSQKPESVIRAVRNFLRRENANIHRGVHFLSQEATGAYEGVREKIRGFLNAGSAAEIVFVRGTTEAVNLVAASFGRAAVKAGDEILLSIHEHHSNIVPWQMLCEAAGARLSVIPMNDAGELIIEEYEKRLTPRTRLVAVTHVSNALGTVNPVRDMIAKAHAKGIPVLVDGAQAVPHFPVDVRDLDCDFYAFSGHKLYGPTGIGVLYGKRAHLEKMPPWQGGGDMILSVTFEKTTYKAPPGRFEAGTPAIAEVIGLGAAVDYLARLDRAGAERHEAELLRMATERVAALPGVRVLGTARAKTGVLSFVMDGVHPHDIGTVLDSVGVAIRAGHHCAQPLMERLGVPATARASFTFYNSEADVDALVRGLEKVREIFK
ncbi:MAG: cysteine desulfurase [Planctomycetota bacterium]